MRAVDVIRSKREGGELRREEIFAFVQGATDGSWEAYQLSALLMAIVLRGMTPDETATLTAAMVRSGERLDLSDCPAPRLTNTARVGSATRRRSSSRRWRQRVAWSSP